MVSVNNRRPIGLVGNSLVLYLFSKTKDLRSPANMFVVNLAFSDLCMMITQFPMFVYNSFCGGIWLFGPFLCELYACTGSIFGLCSICTMAAISYDRYNVIVNGMNGTRMTFGKQNELALKVGSYQSVPYSVMKICRKSSRFYFHLLGVRHRMEHATFPWVGSLHS